MKRSTQKVGSQMSSPRVYGGYQWGEPPNGKSCFPVNRGGEELEITAAMPAYLFPDSPCDLVRQYEIAHKNRSIGKQRTGKDSPHIRFANANSDNELIDFVRYFGPVVAHSWKMLPFVPPSSAVSAKDTSILMSARQNLQELRIERQIYKAALGLVMELAKNAPEFNIDSAKERMAEIALGVQKWPRQWKREKEERDHNPLWRVRVDSMQRIAAFAKPGPDPLLPTQVDARIVICELLNMFPSLVFPNPLEMHSHIRFGIRPLLYSLVRREFLQPRGVNICANTQCRAFFEPERAGLRFCDDVCSRQQRQRDNWQTRGKEARRERLAAAIKRRNI
jgi:hypothetical protein